MIVSLINIQYKIDFSCAANFNEADAGRQNGVDKKPRQAGADQFIYTWIWYAWWAWLNSNGRDVLLIFISNHELTIFTVMSFRCSYASIKRTVASTDITSTLRKSVLSRWTLRSCFKCSFSISSLCEASISAYTWVLHQTGIHDSLTSPKLRWSRNCW